MSKQPEIYCFLDIQYKENIDASIDLLRKHGYRVVVGDDIQELQLLLEVSDPAAIVFTLVSDDSHLENAFQSIASKALEQSVPMILIGPETAQKGFTLYYPMDPFLDGKQIPPSQLASALDEIHGTSGAVPWEGSAFEPSSDGKLVDAFENGEDSVTIETSVTDDEEPRIMTQVYRRGEVIVRERQAVHRDEPELAEKIEAQHKAALNSYAPASPRSQRGPTSEVSGPIVLPGAEQEAMTEPETGMGGRRRFSRLALIGGMIVFCGVVFYLSTRHVTPLPKPISGPEMPHAEPEISHREDAIVADDAAPSSTAPTTIEEMDISADDVVFADSDTVLFPGRFRPGRTTFGFRNKSEEQNFVSTILALSEEKRIRLRIRFKDPNSSDRKRRLGTARVHAVLRYLGSQGVRKNTMVVGKPMDTSTVQQAHLRIIDLVIDQS